MAQVDKTVVVFGCLATVETSYAVGTDTVVAATHGVQLADLPSFDPSFSYDGVRPVSPGNYAQGKRAAPTGKMLSTSVRMEGKGPGGTTYSASVVPPNIHDFILASGYDGAVSSGTWTYTPTPGPTGFDSLVLELYGRGEKWPATGCYAAMKITGENEGPAIFEFDVRGILGTRADSAVPSITYDTTVDPPTCDNITLTINSVADLVCRSFEFEDGASIDKPWVDQNAAGHGGFVRGRRSPVLRVTVENPDSSELDLVTLEEAGTAMAASIVVGATARNKFTLTLAQCVMRFSLNDEDPASLVDIELFPHTSSPILNDDISLVFD